MSKRINIPIMFCFDTNYVIPASVAFLSLMEHASKDYDYSFYVLHSDITDSQQAKLNETVGKFKNCRIEFIDMNHKLDDFWSENYKGGHFSKEVMYKLLVASIFPNIDKIIVSDVDVVFLGDVSESYFDLSVDENVYIAGVKPIGKVSGYLRTYEEEWTEEEISKLGKICGGYLVMNLKKIREDNFEKVFLKSLQDNGYRLNQMEQDIFNITCYNHMKYLHLKYVACSYMWDYYKTDEDKSTDSNYTKKEIEEAMNHPVQLHYATSIKPWKNVDCTQSLEWFKYIVRTPFAEEYFSQLPNKIVVPDSRYRVVDLSFKEHVKRRYASFFDKRSDKKIWRIIRKINKVIYTIIRYPGKLFDPRIYRKIYRKLFLKRFTLLIVDDVFPSHLSPFRFEEYMSYNEEYGNVIVASTGHSLPFLKETRRLQDVIDEFKECTPEFKGEIYDISNEDLSKKLPKLNNPLAVITFKHNLINERYNILNELEKNNIPFIFTLYPGGGFVMNDKASNEDLSRIFNSKCFKKVIVTQKITKDYLLDNNLVSEDKIQMIFGGVTPRNMFNKNIKFKKYYKKGKDKLDVVFAARKYSKKGMDKGYDLFIEAMKKFVKKHKDINVHVVGEFDENDIDVKDIKNRIKFYGPLTSYDLQKLYRKMDIIVSPVRPYVLSKGSFDGFPTGASVEAMLNGVALITTDELSLNNNTFAPDKDIFIVKPDANEIYSKLEYLYNNPKEIIKMGKNGYKTTKKTYCKKRQILSRTKVIDNVVKKTYK